MQFSKKLSPACAPISWRGAKSACSMGLCHFYRRGLAYTVKTGDTQANSLGAQRYLREAVRLDPKFALGWALLSDIDARGYVTQALQPTLALREEARQAAEIALTLQPNLGEALLAKGMYHYGCLKDYDTAVRYFLRCIRKELNTQQMLKTKQHEQLF